MFLRTFVIFTLFIVSTAKAYSFDDIKDPNIRSRVLQLFKQSSTRFGPNCYNSALIVAGIQKHMRHTSANEFFLWLRLAHCQLININEPILEADISILYDNEHNPLHAYNELGNGNCISKVGTPAFFRNEIITCNKANAWFKHSQYIKRYRCPNPLPKIIFPFIKEIESIEMRMAPLFNSAKTPEEDPLLISILNELEKIQSDLTRQNDPKNHEMTLLQLENLNLQADRLLNPDEDD